MQFTQRLDGDIKHQIQERWFRMIDQGAEIQFIVEKNGEKKRKIVPKLKRPALDESQGLSNAKKALTTSIVKLHGKRIGELRNLELCIAKNEFDENDKHWGIALLKNGKQCITRFNDFLIN